MPASAVRRPAVVMQSMAATSRAQPQTVLVLDADGRCGLACVQSLGRAGVEVDVGVRARGSLTERSRWCDRIHLESCAASSKAAQEWLLRLDSGHAFTLVLPTAENSLR